MKSSMRWGEGSLFVDLGDPTANVVVSYFPPDKAKLGAFHYLKEHFGKVEKEHGGHIVGSKDGVTVRLFGACECRVVGHETVEIPATDARLIEKPIYECLSPLAAASKPAQDEVPF